MDAVLYTHDEDMFFEAIKLFDSQKLASICGDIVIVTRTPLYHMYEHASLRA